MNKKIIKIAVLALGIFTFAAIYTNAQTSNGVVTLTIQSGSSTCTFNDFNLSGHTMTLGSPLTITGLSNSGTTAGSGIWKCVDWRWWTGNWSYYISATNASGTKWSFIPAANIKIKHSPATVVGDTIACKWGTATDAFTSINSGYTLMERIANVGSGNLCDITLSGVTIEVTVPAYQAPDTYTSQITVTANPPFFTISKS